MLMLGSQGECAWKALDLLKNGSKTCVIIQSQTPLQTWSILSALFFIRLSSNFGWKQPEVSYPFRFLIFSLFSLPGHRDGGVELQTTRCWVTDGQEKAHYCCCDQWSTGPSEEPSDVLMFSIVSQLGTCLVSSRCCSEVVTEVSLCAWVHLCLFFIFLLTSSSHLEALSADSASELWRCCCRGSHHLHFLVFCAQASSYAFGKAEIWPWNFVFPFLFLIATLYVLLMRLFQVIRLISDTFINLWFWE